MTVGHLTVPYKGLLATDIFTYTTTYPFKTAGWNNTTNAIMLVEFQHYTIDGTTTVAIEGNVTDKNFGVTPFVIGDKTGAAVGSNASGYWQGGFLKGICFVPNATGQAEPWWFSFPLILGGGGINLPTFTPTLKLAILPNLPNTVAPSPNHAYAWSIVDGFPIFESTLFSYLNNLDDFWGYYNTTQGSHSTDSVNAVGISGVFKVRGIIPYNNLNWCLMNDQTAQQRLLMQTDFLNFFNIWSATFENPPNSNIDVDGFMHVSGNISTINSTLNGFIYFIKNTGTINGLTLNGYAVIILPDFSGYYIVQINGTDAASNTWYSNGGVMWGMIDYSDNLFMKSNNHDALLFASRTNFSMQPNVRKYQSILPPVAMPHNNGYF